mmetsp:Transcript_29681/g.79702  ORF Transcript_29681/g.79702 Transcript_29681/m.79702 type:complete len:179 (-) Transcript_29681:319-855(-)
MAAPAQNEAKESVRVAGEGAFAAVNDDLEQLVVEEHWRGESVLILRNRKSGRLWAAGNHCPHAGYPLSEGDIEDLGATFEIAAKLDAPVVSCPAHAYIFDMQRGTCLSESKCPPTTVFEVAIKDGDVHLSKQPRADEEVGSHVLTQDEANQLQLKMVEVALDKKYGKESACHQPSSSK